MITRTTRRMVITVMWFRIHIYLGSWMLRFKMKGKAEFNQQFFSFLPGSDLGSAYKNPDPHHRLKTGIVLFFIPP